MSSCLDYCLDETRLVSFLIKCFELNVFVSKIENSSQIFEKVEIIQKIMTVQFHTKSKEVI